MLSNDIVLRTDKSQPKLQDGKETGLIEYIGQRTYGDFMGQFVKALKSINVDGWDSSAYDNADYVIFGAYGQDDNKLLPVGKTIIYACEGSNEGHRIEVAVVDKNNQFIPILSVKFLCDRDEVWLTAKDLEMALWNGGYGF